VYPNKQRQLKKKIAETK